MVLNGLVKILDLYLPMFYDALKQSSVQANSKQHGQRVRQIGTRTIHHTSEMDQRWGFPSKNAGYIHIKGSGSLFCKKQTQKESMDINVLLVLHGFLNGTA